MQRVEYCTDPVSSPTLCSTACCARTILIHSPTRRSCLNRSIKYRTVRSTGIILQKLNITPRYFIAQDPRTPRIGKCGCLGTFFHIYIFVYRPFDNGFFTLFRRQRPKTTFDFGKHEHTTVHGRRSLARHRLRVICLCSLEAIYTDQSVRAPLSAISCRSGRSSTLVDHRCRKEIDRTAV